MGIKHVKDYQEKDKPLCRRPDTHGGRDCDFLKRVFQALPDLIFYKDTRSVYTGCNDAFGKLVGFPVDQVVGKTDFDLFPPDLAKAFTDCDKQVMEDRQPRNVEEWATFFDVCEQRVLVHGGSDYGLAPALALRSLKLFGGDVHVHNTGREGFVITATLPEDKRLSGKRE